MDLGFSIGELVLGYRSNTEWTMALYVENLTDEVYYDSNYASDTPDNIFPELYWGVGRPRTAGHAVRAPPATGARMPRPPVRRRWSR